MLKRKTPKHILNIFNDLPEEDQIRFNQSELESVFSSLQLSELEMKVAILSKTLEYDKPLSQREIARRIGMSQPGVRKVLMRIQRKIVNAS